MRSRRRSLLFDLDLVPEVADDFLRRALTLLTNKEWFLMSVAHHVKCTECIFFLVERPCTILAPKQGNKLFKLRFLH